MPSPITTFTSIEELKEIFLEILLDKTDRVSKVDEGSVLNGIAFGVAKAAQVTLKEIKLVESHIFPDQAYGPYLDAIAERMGITPRLGPVQSSGFVRVVAAPGTQYIAGTQQFFSTSGEPFNLEQNVTVGGDGFAYLKITSVTAAAGANVQAFAINRVSPTPNGHRYVVNEYAFQGGRDQETDLEFRNRIMAAGNLNASGTVERLTQFAILVNPAVLRLVYLGTGNNGQNILGVITRNGASLTGNELATLSSALEQILPLSDLRPFGGRYVGTVLQNIDYFPIDVSFRCQVDPGFDNDVVRSDVQVRVGKYFDWRTWEPTKQVVWTDLLNIVRNTPGMTRVFNNAFFPRVDFLVPRTTIPRVRAFQMLDQNGGLISSGSGNLNPAFYPAVVDQNLISSLAII